MTKRKKALSTSIHKRIIELRLDAGKTHVQMARFMGVHLSTYHKYETGTAAPSPVTMMNYIKEYGISLEWLMLNRGPKYFKDITTALKNSETLVKENEALKLELQEKDQLLKDEKEKSKSKKETFVPDGAEVVTEKELVELVQYTRNNRNFKHRLLLAFDNHKENPENQDMPDLET